MQSTFPITLVSSIFVQLLCQAFKVVFYSIRDRRLRLSYFVSAGGMPSAHTAFVTALSVSVALRDGLGSEIFAVSAVFAFIVIYDAFRLRGTVQYHARVLKLLASKHPDVEAGDLTEMVGHSLGEILAGILAGGGFAAIVYCITQWLL
jgi:hypothetical protein